MTTTTIPDAEQHTPVTATMTFPAGDDVTVLRCTCGNMWPCGAVPPVETEVWERDTTPGREGFLRKVRTKFIGEVYAELRAALPFDEYGSAAGCDEYFTLSGKATDPWPEGRIAVFVVTGGSEGHYTHVEVIHGERATLLMLGKTFDGWTAAWGFAQRTARLLGA